MKLFAHVRQLAGVDTLDVDMPAGATIALLCDRIVRETPRLHGRLASLSIALNGEFARPETVLKDGDEVAFLPPFSGG